MASGTKRRVPSESSGLQPRATRQKLSETSAVDPRAETDRGECRFLVVDCGFTSAARPAHHGPKRVSWADVRQQADDYGAHVVLAVGIDPLDREAYCSHAGKHVAFARTDHRVTLHRISATARSGYVSSAHTHRGPQKNISSTADMLAAVIADSG